MTLRILPDTNALADALARQVAQWLRAAVAERGAFHWALAGGRTPATLYRILATKPYADLPWSQVHIWFGDERAVPHHHPDSNFRMVRETLLDFVPIPGQHIHPMPSRMEDLRQGALAYAQALAVSLPRENGLPRLDLALLGMGADGHVASLFPGSAALRETHQAAVANYAPAPAAWRITLTTPTIEQARRIVLLVAGADKASAVARALDPNPRPPPLPVQRLKPVGEVIWYLDAAAASLLPT